MALFPVLESSRKISRNNHRIVPSSIFSQHSLQPFVHHVRKCQNCCGFSSQTQEHLFKKKKKAFLVNIVLPFTFSLWRLAAHFLNFLKHNCLFQLLPFHLSHLYHVSFSISIIWFIKHNQCWQKYSIILLLTVHEEGNIGICRQWCRMEPPLRVCLFVFVCIFVVVVINSNAM